MRNIQDIFFDWVSKPAKWYQFWLPRSSFIGGVIMGLILTNILCWLIL
jgi:hypothetical protein